LTFGANVNWRPLVATALALVPPAAVALRAGGSPGAAELAGHDWPLLLAAVAGGALALAGRRTRGSGAVIVVAAGLLATAYLAKNPASDRYLALLVPAAAILTGLGIGSVRGARLRLATAAAALVAVLGALVIGGPPPPGPDTFGGIAARVRALPPGPLLTAAPDAYGVLLPDRPVRALRPGARGLVLLDAAQRAYEPGVAARGRVVARLEPAGGFRLPDGTLDRGEAVIVRGIAVRGG
jgi:hypothetical protein